MTLILRVFLSLSIIGIFPIGKTSTTHGAEILTASVIAPIVLPIAKDVLTEVAGTTKAAVVALSKKKNRCSLCNKAFFCKTRHAFSMCKSDCTEVHQIGGYELRIRFGEGWSLAACVKKGVAAGLQTFEGKGNIKSIAVYSQKDLNYLQELIALQMAARMIVDTDGKNIRPQDLEEMGISRQEAVDESIETVNTITASIQRALKSGMFGNQ